MAEAIALWKQGADVGIGEALVRLVEFDASDVIRRVQIALAAKGFDAGEPDSVVGPRTLLALNAFCQEGGIEDICVNNELTTTPVLRGIARAGLFKP